jgi:hypothetical protein
MTRDQLRELKYEGGGYFRVKAPRGVRSPTIHGPELLRILLELLEQLEEHEKGRDDDWIYRSRS